MTEETLFQEALARSPEARAAFLEQACAGQPELRAAVAALLAAHEHSGNRLDRPLTAMPLATGEYTPRPDEAPPPVKTTDYQPDAAPGAVIAGRYTLVEKIGEGGMGEVWVAKQTEPVKRRVALKLIKAGMDTKAVVQRFEAERQALAMMDHPNIARVLDGGMTADRRPFFVMELVNGLPLTKFCDEAKLGIRERLELFTAICQAVQHAHQKGIVHRDLKPANILITLIDGKPVPKVIDFGVAKAMAGRLTDESMSTQFGAVVGTLEYMSPEQAGFSGIDIDTRADIYSLGVILYELLTGLRPIEAKRLKKAALTEMIRIIQEEEPSKPSTRLSTDESLPSLAAVRQTEPKKLMAMLRGELDWVVMKCLEKQRDRRYETANGLARDIQRYLADEPVEARPPSATYRLQKFVSRHRGPVIATCLVMVTLLLGIVGTTIGWFEARRQEGFAKLETTEKEEARKAEAVRADGERRAKIDAVAARAQAEKRLEQLDEGNKIITAIFTDLDMSKVKAGREPLEAVLANRLVEAAAQLEGESVGDPLVVAELQLRLGRSLIALSYSKEAIGVCVKARDTLTTLRGPNHVETLTSMNVLASAYYGAGKLDLALPLFEETLKLFKITLGPDHPDTLSSMNNVALAYEKAGNLERALPLFEEALRLSKAKQGPDHPGTLSSMNNLAQAYKAAGKLDQALPMFVETLRISKATLGAEHLTTVAHMYDLALAYQAAGKLELSLPLFEQILRIRRLKLGSMHDDTLRSIGQLAHAYQVAGKLDLALPLFEEVQKLFRATLGIDHPDTLVSTGHLADAYQVVGKLNLALPLYEENLKLLRAKRGADHPHTLTVMSNLAQAYQAVGKFDLALPLQVETLKLTRAKLGPDHPDTLNSMQGLASAYRVTDRQDLALPLYEESLKIMKVKLGPNHPETLIAMNNLGLTYQDVGKLDLAIPLLEETLKLQTAKLGADHPQTLDSRNNLGLAYRDAGKLSLALSLFEENLKLRKAKQGPDHPTTLVGMNNLALTHLASERYELALPLFEETLRLKRAKLGADHPSTLITLAALGSALLQQKKWAEAEPVLRECLAHRRRRQPDAWSTFYTQSLLGGALLGQKKYADAEPLLLAGYEGMKQREKTIPAQGNRRIPEALERLVQLYEATDKKDEAAKWRQELEASNAAERKPEGKP